LLALVPSSWSIAATADGGTQVQPSLEILGTHATEGVKLAVTGPELKRELRIQSTTTAPVDSLRVIVTPLRDGAGQLWDVSWDLAGKGPETPVSVSALGSVLLTLTAELPSTGTYTAELFLV
jgi:hypothetical protein